MMFNEGDKYIHFTKYGGINRGEVKRYGQTIHWDTTVNTAYYEPYIVTAKDFNIKLDGSDGRVYKIKEDITEEMLIKLKSSATVLAELKRRKNESENNIS